MSKILRFAALIRVSTEQQEKTGESLKTQRKENESSVKQLGGKIVAWYGGQEHATPGHEKKEVDRLLADAIKGKFDAVIVANADRWSRDNSKSQEGLNLLKDHKVRFFVSNTEYDLYNPEHCLFLGMSAVIGRFQAHHQKRKSLLNRIERAKKGMPACGKLPFGRTFNKKDGSWGIDERKQAIIKKIAKRYLAGEKMSELADEHGMNHANLHKVLTTRSGTDWKIEFKSEDLNIEEVVTVKIPRLLDDKTIAAILKRAKANKTYDHGQATNAYLLSGFLFCDHCGYSMFGQTNHGNRKYYRHAHTKRERPCKCEKGWVRCNEIEEMVLRQLFQCFGNPKAMKAAIEKAIPNRDKLEAYQAQVNELDSKTEKLKAGKDKILRLISRETISEEDAEKQLLEIKRKLVETEEQKQRMIGELENLPSSESLRAFTNTVVEQFMDYGKRKAVVSKDGYVDAVSQVRLKYINREYNAMTFEEKRFLVKQIFDGITVEGRPMGVYIHWDKKSASEQRKSWTYSVKGKFIEIAGRMPVSQAELAELLDDEIPRVVQSARH